MRALAIVAMIGLGLLSAQQATAADLRVRERVISSPGYIHQPTPICDPYYGACVPYFGPLGYRFIGRSHVYLPDFPRCRTVVFRTPDGLVRRVRHCT